MAKKIIMIACVSGLSSALLVSKMKQAAQKKNKDYQIITGSISEIETQLPTIQPDVLLLGPQIQYLKEEVQKKTSAANIPVAVINMQDYAMMDGEKVLAQAESLLNN